MWLFFVCVFVLLPLTGGFLGANYPLAGEGVSARYPLAGKYLIARYPLAGAARGRRVSE